MTYDTSIPCFAELDDWPITPHQPLIINSFGRYRDGGPQGGTYYVDLKDAVGIYIPFFFDRFLGRLCYGSTYETGDDAAFLKPGSKLEREAFALIEALAAGSAEYSEVLEKLTHARTWLKGET